MGAEKFSMILTLKEIKRVEDKGEKKNREEKSGGESLEEFWHLCRLSTLRKSVCHLWRTRGFVLCPALIKYLFGTGNDMHLC